MGVTVGCIDERRWDEMGRYDIPANIDYILETTGEEKLIYVGHSLGCTLFYIAMIEHPHLNDKIENMISLAPTTSVASLNNYLRYMAPILTPMEVRIHHWILFNYHYYDYKLIRYFNLLNEDLKADLKLKSNIPLT